MAIRRNYNGYRVLFNKYNLEIDSSKKYLKKIKIYETISKVFLFLTILLSSIIIYEEITMKSNSSGSQGLTLVLMLIIILVVGLILWKIFDLIKKSNISKLDDLIFNQYLIAKIKIFYSLTELTNYQYEKIEHITTKVINETNHNQAMIDLTFIAFEKNADGIIIISNDQTSVITGSIGRKGNSTISSTIINSSEAILIKNIKENTSTNDLNYWFKLKEKGAISEEEYNSKKKEFFVN